MVLAGRANGIADADITTAINTMVGAYVDKMSSFQGSSAELSFALTNGNTSGAVQDVIAKSKGDSRASLLSKYTQVSGGTRSLQTVAGALATVPTLRVRRHRRRDDAVRQHDRPGPAIRGELLQGQGHPPEAGLGRRQPGRAALYVLVDGPSTSASDDVILEMKQEVASTVATVDNGLLPAGDYGGNEGGRVAMTSKAQLLNADVLAGKLNTAATYFGQALASAHAVSDQDYDSAIVSYSIDKQVTSAVTSKSGLESEIATFAINYAAQVQLDWQGFVAAYKAGATLY